jgi:uncharacterized protein (TIGR00251 family)
MNLCLKEKDGAVLFKVLVQPRASRNELVGIHGDCLKIRITSPPVENQANKKVCEFLSKLMGVGKGQVEIVEGQKSKVKKVRITNSTPEEVRKKLDQLV